MEWFVITDEEHLGPFDEDGLLSMYESGEIDGESFVWQEGWEEALQFQAVFETQEADESSDESIEEEAIIGGDSLELSLDSLDDDEEEAPTVTTEPVRDPNLPPDLPPLPTEAEIRQDLGLESAAQEPEESFQEITRPQEEFEESEEEMDFEGDFAEDEEGEEESTSKGRLVKIVVGILLILGLLGGGAFWFLTQKQEIIRPSMMSSKDFNRLKEVAQTEGQKNLFAFALSKDKKTIWVATNNPLEGKVFVKIKGEKNKSLGDYIEAKGTGTLKGHLIEIKDLKFLVGSRLVDGIYDVSIKSVGNLTIPIQRRFIHENNVKIDFQKKVLISTFDMRTFKKQLAKFLKAKFTNSKSYWQEIVQKYQTVKMITDQIKLGFQDLFKDQPAPWEQRIANFEAQYRNKWGQFFTEFVKANESSYEKLSAKKFDEQEKVLASYNNLSNLAIDIGETAMVALEKLQQFDFEKAKLESLEELKNTNTESFDKIIQSCEEKIKEIGE